jgi:hypothetical protein
MPPTNILNKGEYILDWQCRANHSRWSDLLCHNLLQVAPDGLRGLRQAGDDRIDHGLGPLSQGGVVELPDRIRGLGDDDVRTALCGCQTAREVGEGISGDHDGWDPSCFKRGCDVAIPRRARPSVTSGGDDDVHPFGEVIERTSKLVDEPTAALRQFTRRLLHHHGLETITLRQ